MIQSHSCFQTFNSESSNGASGAKTRRMSARQQQTIRRTDLIMRGVARKKTGTAPIAVQRIIYLFFVGNELGGDENISDGAKRGNIFFLVERRQSTWHGLKSINTCWRPSITTIPGSQIETVKPWGALWAHSQWLWLKYTTPSKLSGLQRPLPW